MKLRVSRRIRLDAELVRRGLARSRQHAIELINAGKITVNGIRATKPATAVDVTTHLNIITDDNSRSWVSRGAYKLIGALDTFKIDVTHRCCLDAGASTGGFTEVLLDRGADQVIAVDVGYGQLAWTLRTDPRVEVIERTNIRHMTIDQIGKKVNLIVADLSFISLTKVLPALINCATDQADIIPMIKPQFEVGKGLVGPKGVVTDPQLRAQAVYDVACYAHQLHWITVNITPSPLPGPSGNIEYFLHLRYVPNQPLNHTDLNHMIQYAITGNHHEQ